MSPLLSLLFFLPVEHVRSMSTMQPTLNLKENETFFGNVYNNFDDMALRTTVIVIVVVVVCVLCIAFSFLTVFPSRQPPKFSGTNTGSKKRKNQGNNKQTTQTGRKPLKQEFDPEAIKLSNIGKNQAGEKKGLNQCKGVMTMENQGNDNRSTPTGRKPLKQEFDPEAKKLSNIGKNQAGEKKKDSINIKA